MNYDDIIQAVLKEYEESTAGYAYNVKKSKTWAEISKLSRAEQSQLALALGQAYQQQTERHRDDPNSNAFQKARQILSVLVLILNRKLPFTVDNIIEFLSVCQQQRLHTWHWHTPIKKLVRDYLKDNDLTPGLQAAVEATCDSWAQGYGDERKTASQLRLLISAETKTLAILPGEAWSDVAKQTIEALPETEQSAWIQLIEACSTASGGKPTTNWLKTTRPLQKTVGIDTFQQYVLHWYPLVDQPRTQPLTHGGDDTIQDC